MKEVIAILILKRFGQKNFFFEGCSRFNFNNLGFTLGMTIKFYTTVTAELRVGKFRGLIPVLLIPEVKEG